MEIIQKAPAKINLSLDARFRHPDGEHEWKMVMTSVDLADYVHLRPSRHLRVTTDSGFLPEDPRNLAYQAALALQRASGVRSGAAIHIEKHIPVAAGLGGGSSDAAAVLRGLNELWQLHYTKQQLAEIGLQVDSDVPYCVYSETALVTGKGEQVAPLGPLPNFWVVLAKPRVSVSTPTILNAVDYSQPLIHPNTDAVLAGINAGDFGQMSLGMANSLEALTAKRHPEITAIKHRLLKYGAQVAQMSGSGPTVFGLCEKYSRANRVYNSMKGFCREVYLLRPMRLSQQKEA
ncbi:4-(cytidine 5'-diphospho)-2-C-methyl-D-erythritol kinase [Lacticaseibacillus saniviri]|uniref:4-diphosphocytidyl-2-C-methyl-D-erythritol kinase n=1 Tax=Lacticaseibacillus saniviri JCM 17471 = DSM 24301 TaxID=1293598 RepID=A0A0R2MUV4_9LACO|nr:4-(cytidine 5'-diphospho)-2-C-methyl-D-erythritol kinase [Lacticaseibacillus saniviri]KRO17302.1 4-(cytidine 5-diphospho)-2-C-methyl-D-erythritol kinase [Lacticaseibacillus saniviri JCM 17471 = DSM 24301]MCG4282661.1 4-(cytidine 5'-diphospho)-2-C-methyl-D-erythritol kinase [Lacticaseibacillus saniviri]